MKKLLLIFTLLVLPFGVQATEVKEVITPQNFKIWYVEDHSLPIISLSITFDHAGSAYDPAGKDGLANLVSGMMNEGAGDLDGYVFRRRLEEKGIYMSFSEGYDSFNITIKTMTENLDIALEMASLAFSKPRFDKEPLEMVKSQVLGIIAKNKENPESIAEKKWYSIVFAGHPYGRHPMGDKATLSGITRKDLVNYAQENFAQSRIYISAAGDFNGVELGKKIDKYFSVLPKKGKVVKDLNEAGDFQSTKSVTVLYNVPQSFAVFGFPGVKRDHPEFFAAFLLNYVIGGGGFESRLMNEVREKRGLAYSVSTGVEAMDYAGFFLGYVATRKEKMAESLNVIKEELLALKRTGIGEDELEGAKKYLTGAFDISLDTNDKLARFINNMQLEKLDINYINERNNRIEAVTSDDVNRLINRVIDPDKVVTVVVGSQ